MAETNLDFANGGNAVVMVGNTGLVKEYQSNPRVLFVECLKVKGDELDGLMPQNTKAVIITEGLPQYHSTWIFAYCKRKDLVYVVRKNNQAVYDQLNKWFKSNGSAPVVTQEEAKDTQVKGKLKELIPLIDFSKSNTENAHILMREAARLGIATTPGSLAQLVSNNRRKGGATDVPRSIRSKLDITVEMFDRMILDLQGMRDFIIETTDENRTLKMKVERFKKALDE